MMLMDLARSNVLWMRGAQPTLRSERGRVVAVALTERDREPAQVLQKILRWRKQKQIMLVVRAPPPSSPPILPHLHRPFPHLSYGSATRAGQTAYRPYILLNALMPPPHSSLSWAGHKRRHRLRCHRGSPPDPRGTQPGRLIHYLPCISALSA